MNSKTIALCAIALSAVAVLASPSENTYHAVTNEDYAGWLGRGHKEEIDGRLLGMNERFFALADGDSPTSRRIDHEESNRNSIGGNSCTTFLVNFPSASSENGIISILKETLPKSTPAAAGIRERER